MTAPPPQSGQPDPSDRSELTRDDLIEELVELIAALDRRVPRVERAGELAIARDAAALKARALKRIEELESEPGVRP